MKKICLFGLALAFAGAAQAQYVSLNKAELTKLKQLVKADQSAGKQYAMLQQSADVALADTPHPIDTIHTEGRLKGDPQKTATAAALLDMHKMYALALVYKVNGDKKYLNKTINYLLAWASVNKANGDPIDDTNLDQAVEAYDLIKDELRAADNKMITDWLIQTAAVEIKKVKPGRETSYNNWHSHRLKVVGEIAYAINDVKLQQYVNESLKVQLAKNLDPDGGSIDFRLRDALHYHVYDLEPLLKLAIILKRATGTNYYTYVSETQTSIQKSVKWLLPYIKGDKTHEEFVNTTVSFDRKRAANGEAGYKSGSLFNPKSGRQVVTLTAYFEPDAANVLQKLDGSTESYNDWQMVLNKVRE